MAESGEQPALDGWTRRLYDRAIAEQWDAARDIAWDEMTLEQVGKPIREAMGMAYAHVYYAESVGLGLCGRLVDVAPAGWLRQFAATQVLDEARHVDFFSRLLGKLDAPMLAPPGLLEFAREMRDVRDEIGLLLHGQIVENAAQTFFLEASRRSRAAMERSIRIPGSAAVAKLLEYLIDRVARDEARHIAFGQRYLAAKLEDITAGEREALARRVLPWCRIFYDSFAELGPHVTRLGLPADEILAQVWATQRRQLLRVGLEIGPHGAEMPPRDPDTP